MSSQNLARRGACEILRRSSVYHGRVWFDFVGGAGLHLEGRIHILREYPINEKQSKQIYIYIHIYMSELGSIEEYEREASESWHSSKEAIAVLEYGNWPENASIEVHGIGKNSFEPRTGT